MLSYTLATSAGQFSNVGSYAITVSLGSNPNYSVTPTNGMLTIGQKAATVTANDKSKTYGDANPALDATVTGTVNGDVLSYTLATSAGQFSNVGSYAITVSLGSNPNYSVTPTNGMLTIGQKAATVTANDKSKTYGDANPALDATVTGTVNGDVLAYTLSTAATQFSNVGSYAITVSLGTNANYSVTPTNGTLTIGQKAATVTANDKSKTYGDANPALDATVTGTVNGDVLDYTLATAATQFSNVGGYAITVSLGTNRNYSVTPTNGTLTIGQKAATVTANAKSKTYGDANPALDATVTGTVNGDVLAYTLSTAATQFSNVGGYAITVSLGSNGNYSVTPTNGTLTIGQKAATVTANDKSKTYGDANPALDATVTGTVNGDVLAYTLSTAATQFSNVGGYAITVSLGTNGNYSVTPTNGTLTITKANQFISWANPADAPAGVSLDGTQLNATVDGIAGDPNKPGDLGLLSYTPPAGTQYNTPGTYILSVTAAATQNYKSATTSVPFKVVPVEARVAYIGQTTFVTSGTSATTTQVHLTASLQGLSTIYTPLGTGTVSFYDVNPNHNGGIPILLAGNVKVSPVPGYNNLGTADTIVTLSTGQYGLDDYMIEVRAGGSFANPQQLLNTVQFSPTVSYFDGTSVNTTSKGLVTSTDDPAYQAAHVDVVVRQPTQANQVMGDGFISPLASAVGLYGGVAATDIHFSIAMTYNKSLTNLKGQIVLDWFVGTTHYTVKSNSISSMSVTYTNGSPTLATIYTKASLYKVDPNTGLVSLDGNVTFRTDVYTGGGKQQVAFTVLSSKDGTLYYSNNWQYDLGGLDAIGGSTGTKSWRSILQNLTGGALNIS